jgi:hypothetical protein
MAKQLMRSRWSRISTGDPVFREFDRSPFLTQPKRQCLLSWTLRGKQPGYEWVLHRPLMEKIDKQRRDRLTSYNTLVLKTQTIKRPEQKFVGEIGAGTA